MKKVLVLATDYPNNDDGVSLMYIHTRNLCYAKNNIDVTVLNFRTVADYVIDGIKVISLDSYKRKGLKFDILIIHAANLRNHYRFLKKYGNRFPRFVFFYHGHEVLRINKVYSKPYPYVRQGRIKFIFQDCYDFLKLFIWRHYLPKVVEKSDFIFVSHWMYDEFFKNTKIKENILKEKCSITYNSVGYEFESQSYDPKVKKKYDFITIRANLDGSKYSIDVVNRLAFNSPNCKFLVIGKGKYFEHYPKAKNITWKDTTLSHDQIICELQTARFALMPTKTDAQGLMMCEMAAFGIPVITSDIPVCHEVFDDFDNVTFVNNNDENATLESYLHTESCAKKDTRYFINNTIVRELRVLNRI